MSTPESKVKVKVKALLNDYGAFHHWPVQTGYGEPTLDCVGCHRGKYFAVETKAPGQKLTPRQELTKERMEQAGAKVFVIGQQEFPYPPMRASQFGYTHSGLMELEAWLLQLMR